MARIDVPDGEGLEAARLWRVAPEMGRGMQAMSRAVHVEASLPVREREAMRMRIAQLNQCDV